MGLEAVEMVLLEVSIWSVGYLFWSSGFENVFCMYVYIPLFCAPQTSQVRNVLRLVLVSRRLPQSVQKTRDPMAAMVADCMCLITCGLLTCEYAGL